MEGVAKVLRGSNVSLPRRRESMRAPNALWIPAVGDLLIKLSPPPFARPLRNSPFPPLRGRCRRQRGGSPSQGLSGCWRRTPPLSLRDISPRKGGRGDLCPGLISRFHAGEVLTRPDQERSWILAGWRSAEGGSGLPEAFRDDQATHEQQPRIIVVGDQLRDLH